MKPQEQLELREKVDRCLYKALLQVCGGSVKTSMEAERIQEILTTSISFTNKKGTSKSADGKPHDVEIRVALSLFHQWRQRLSGCNGSIQVVSDLGLVRTVSSPYQLALLLCQPLEEGCRDQGIAHDVQVAPSGIICIVTCNRSQVLRISGKLPCPHCTQWCKGMI